MWHWIIHGILLGVIVMLLVDWRTFLWRNVVYSFLYWITVRAGGYVILIDIDNLKQINKKFGHGGGNRALRRVGLIVRKNGLGFLGFRYGGDELALLCPWSNKEKVMRIAQRIKEEVESLSIDRMKITISIGVARYEEDADKMLYKAKELGKNRVVVEN